MPTVSTLCLSGWAQPHDGLAEIVPEGAIHIDYSAVGGAAHALQLLEEVGAAQLAVGWSLGGTLLVQAIAEKRLRVRKLVLIGTPLQFVATPDFPYGMDRLTYDLFVESYRKDALRTAKRFSTLVAKGDSRHDAIIEALGFWPGSADAKRWLPWLESLAHYSLQGQNFEGFPPTLIVQGAADAVVSPRQADAWQQAIPSGALYVFPEAGHAPHLHAREEMRHLIATHRRED